MQVVKNILLRFFTAWAVIVFFFFALLGIPCYLWITLFERKNKAVAYMNYNRFWSHSFSFFTGIKYRFYGREKLVKDQPYVIVSNHSSTGDLFIAATSVPLDYRILGKMELKRMPIMGYLFSKMIVFVDRSSPESRRESYKALAEIIQQQGISIHIFPEGTRNRTQDPLKSFYDGAFRLAIESQVPIIPLIFTGVKKVYPNDRFLLQPGTLSSHYGDPILTTGYCLDDLPMLKERVYRIMEQMVIELDDAFAHLRAASASTAGIHVPPSAQTEPIAGNNPI